MTVLNFALTFNDHLNAQNVLQFQRDQVVKYSAILVETSPQKSSILQHHWYEKYIRQLRITNRLTKHFLDRKSVGRGRGNLKYIKHIKAYKTYKVKKI